MELRNFVLKCICNIIIIICLILFTNASNERTTKSVKKIGKDVRDMTDADLEQLLDQWEEGDDPLEPDELPEHLRPQPKIDLSQMDFKNPDNLLKMSKKGKSLMMFVDIKSELTESEADSILRIWQSSLQNNHIIAERYPIGANRAIFMFRDGAQAVDAKNFLIEQLECSHITLDGQNFVGKHASKDIRNKLEKLKPRGTVEKVDIEKNEL